MVDSQDELDALRDEWRKHKGRGIMDEDIAIEEMGRPVRVPTVEVGIAEGWLRQDGNHLVSATPKGTALIESVVGRMLANPATVLMTGLTLRDCGATALRSGKVPERAMKKLLRDAISA